MYGNIGFLLAFGVSKICTKEYLTKKPDTVQHVRAYIWQEKWKLRLEGGNSDSFYIIVWCEREFGQLVSC